MFYLISSLVKRLPDRDIHIQTDIAVEHTEGDRGRGAVLIFVDLFQVDEVYTPIFSGFTAKGKTLFLIFKAYFETGIQITIQ